MRDVEYIWFKNGKESKRSTDPEGENPTVEKLPNGGEVQYKYFEHLGELTISGEYYYKDGVIHRGEDKPAWTEWDIDGKKSQEVYKIQGKYHRSGD